MKIMKPKHCSNCGSKEISSSYDNTVSSGGYTEWFFVECSSCGAVGRVSVESK